MSIESIKPLCELKGHKAPVLAVEYADISFLGNQVLASGSGKLFLFLSRRHKPNGCILSCRGQYLQTMGSQI